MVARRSLRTWMIVMVVLASAIVLSACTLGQQSGTAPVTDITPAVADPQAEPAVEEAAPDQALPTETPFIQAPPTDTPVPQLLPAEQIASIGTDAAEYAALDTVTITVVRGVSVSDMTCSWTLNETGQTGALGAATSTAQIDANSVQETYTFAPDASGTYQVNCNGTASTVNGQRSVNAASSPFTVQQKG